MDIQTIMIFYEVNKVLDVLGEEYTNKLPQELYTFIKGTSNRIKKYNDIVLNKVNKDLVKRKSAAMITLFNLNYWSDTEEKKVELCRLLKNKE